MALVNRIKAARGGLVIEPAASKHPLHSHCSSLNAPRNPVYCPHPARIPLDEESEEGASCEAAELGSGVVSRYSSLAFKIS